ncbi:hypothetical protein [Halococcus hamelinensis]|uniref:Photosynthesis system II assembly factor Ycf48/Hcf136-like domain-containing protein n=1 Tax=Halococcus hamelinensis 100A6 TaxID=1132509 RepID=M0M6F6_9EURY|nr:hypothetical protein [Halococcus hamelinensis]EMA41397.1 hypothetical protein C447_01045 [Halococcus hamelinensis 100A6]
MTASEGERRGFFAYYREYAKSGLHAASAAALTALIGIASFTGIRWFVLVAIAVYVLPPVFLYSTGEGERVPSVVGEDTGGSDDGRGSGDGENGRTTHETETGTGGDAVGNDTVTDRRAEPDEHDAGTQFDAGSDDGDSTAGTRDRSRDRDSEPTTTAAESEDGSETPETDDEPEAGPEDENEDEPADGGGADPEVEPGWETVDTPTEESLLDVVATPDGAYAVGENGIVLTREDDGWAAAVEGGPTANGNPLRGVDATADGGGVWFAGDSGVLGRYAEGKLTDHSAPEDQTSTWTDVAVTGRAGDERVHLVNGSGELLRGRYDDGRVSWGEVEKPGSGSSISSVSFVDDDRGYLCDTSQGVYGTTDGGENYERVGIDDANTAFTGVDAAGSTVAVACDDGAVFRYDGSVWTRLHAAETTLSAIDLAGESGLAAGDAGTVVELVNGGWEGIETPVDADLAGAVAKDGSSGFDIAVGTGGTVIERGAN